MREGRTILIEMEVDKVLGIELRGTKSVVSDREISFVAGRSRFDG